MVELLYATILGVLVWTGVILGASMIMLNGKCLVANAGNMERLPGKRDLEVCDLALVGESL